MPRAACTCTRHGLPPGCSRNCARLAARHPGLLLEEKGAAVALHYRLAAEAVEVRLQRELDELIAVHADGALARAARFVRA